MALSEQSMKALMGALAPVIHEHVERVTAPLKARIAELEAKPELRYVGVYDKGTRYAAGACVTHDGSLWICKTATVDRPGESPDWQLAVKKGRDAR